MTTAPGSGPAALRAALPYILSGSHRAPELISVAVVAALHCWRRQMLLSLAGGTVCYMLLVQLVFFPITL